MINLFLFVSFFGNIFFGHSPEAVISLRTVQGAQFFFVEVADQPEERSYGLMSRVFLPSDRGMIFVYDREEFRSFWMKNTFIPLDMIFLDAQKKVVDIKKNIPPCHKDLCSFYTSTVPVQYVLEVNGGISDLIGLRLGDRLY